MNNVNTKVAGILKGVKVQSGVKAGGAFDVIRVPPLSLPPLGGCHGCGAIFDLDRLGKVSIPVAR